MFQIRLVVANAAADTEEMVLTNKTLVEKFQVQRTVVLDGTAVEEADAFSENGNNYISVKFTGAGAKKLEQVTSQHVGEKLAIVIDRKLASALNIESPISTPSAQINGNFSQSEADDLARKINQAVVK